MEELYRIKQRESTENLQKLGLIHMYPLHIDVVNNDSGFALYVETPTRLGWNEWEPLYSYETRLGDLEVDADEYIPGYPPHDYAHLAPRGDVMYLRIRQVDEDGNPGEWVKVTFIEGQFTKNTNPPEALEVLGFGNFDSVTWFSGLEEDKH